MSSTPESERGRWTPATGDVLERLRHRKETRLRFLHALYEAAEGSTSNGVRFKELGEQLGLTEEETWIVRSYLANEGLLSGATIVYIVARGVTPSWWTLSSVGYQRGGVRMSGSGRRYAPEFKARMVELVRAGRSPDRLAAEFEPSATAIRRWVEQADRDEGLRKDGLTTAELKEVRELKRELRRVKLERDILAKATAWFARESGSIPRGGCGS